MAGAPLGVPWRKHSAKVAESPVWFPEGKRTAHKALVGGGFLSGCLVLFQPSESVGRIGLAPVGGWGFLFFAFSLF